MPIDRRDCPECGRIMTHCPECDSWKVTPMEDLRPPKPSDVINYGGPDNVTYRHVCWECGWTEEIDVSFERKVYVEDESGDSESNNLKKWTGKIPSLEDLTWKIRDR